MQKVRVYWNLHKDIWSIVSCKSGLVIDYKWENLTLLDAKFVVWLSGQKRVREEGKKNVHAFAVGDEVSHGQFETKAIIIDWDRVKYNPYTDDYFMHKGEDHDEWNEIPKEFVGIIHMESLVHPNGTRPRVYI